MSAGYGDGVLACLEMDLNPQEQLEFLEEIVRQGRLGSLREVLHDDLGRQTEVIEFSCNQGEVSREALEGDLAQLIRDEDLTRGGGLSYDDWCTLLRDDFELALPDYRGPSKIEVALAGRPAKCFYPMDNLALQSRLREALGELSPEQKATAEHLLQALENCRKRSLAFSIAG